LNLAEFSRIYAKPLWYWYAIGTVFLIATNYITMRIPQLAKMIVNALRDNQIASVHVTIALQIIALGFLVIVVRALSRLCIFWPARQIEAKAKDDFFGRILSLPTTFFERYGMGELISRLTNDIGHLRAFYAFAVLQFLNLCFLVGFTVYQMVSVHLLLTVLCLTPLSLMVVMIRYLTHVLHKISLDNQEAIGRLTNRITEAFVNVHVIKISGSSETFVALAEKENEEVFSTNMRSIWIRTVFFPLMNFLMLGSTVIVFFYGGYEFQNGRLSLGDILAFNIYLGFLSFPITAAGIIASLYNRSTAAIIRLEDISKEVVEDKTAVQALSQADLTTPTPLLEIRSLNFDYGDSFALRNISLSLKPGKKIGIAGPIGSGKSTLLQVIMKLYPPPLGSIFFEGQDILSIPSAEYRSHIAYAQQSAFLFSTSIRENLKLGLSPDLSDEILFDALKKAAILNEVMDFQEGLETTIGERGIRLSGGQKQRIALARIFLRQHAKLFLFDDVLSAVDYGTEETILKNILAIPSAFIFVSHRPSVLAHCDEVLIFREGAIVDKGTYTKLKDKI
jgi:ATP-binding cassette, subfamily B, multidrug efflux pump